MKVNTNQLIRKAIFLAMISTFLLGLTFMANTGYAGNGEGELEFRFAEPVDNPKTNLTNFVVAELHGERYRVSNEPELTFKRSVLTAVVVQELEPGEYAMDLQVDSSLWPVIETLTTTNKGSYLAIVVDGALISAPKVLEPIPDGRLTILYARSKQEGLDLARRFSKTPKFVPLEDTRTR